jgi:ATP-dependent DNA ligase
LKIKLASIERLKQRRVVAFDGYGVLALRGGSETRILSRDQRDLGRKFTIIRDSIAALYQQNSFVIGGYTQPAGEWKHMGALLVGVNENGKLKFAGRIGTGFAEKLLIFVSCSL